MNGPWRYYAKWNKSERKRQIPYDPFYTCNLKQNIYIRLIYTEKKLVVARDKDQGNGWKKFQLTFLDSYVCILVIFNRYDVKVLSMG